MEILSTNAENALAEIASPIGRDPASWDGWRCLNFKIPDNKNDHDDCVEWVKNIVESYLRDIKGRIFFCADREVYIICKDVAWRNLKQIAQLISELMEDEYGSISKYYIHDLGENGAQFASMFFERCNRMDFNVSENVSILDKSHEFAMSGLFRDAGEDIDLCPAGAPRVLLVEDDPMTRFMVRKAVKGQCELATAPEGNKVFSLYASYQPDIVFLDINLPDRTGYEVLDWIMNNDPGASVIMFSSNNDMDNIAKSMGHGAKGFISKPFSKEKLMHYIHNHAG